MFIRKISLTGFSVVSLLFASPVCADEVVQKEQNSAVRLPDSAIRVPLTRQSSDYTCGVAALQSVLAYYGDELREDELAHSLKSGRKHGTSYHRIAKFVRSKKFMVTIYKGMTMRGLREELSKGSPVICLIQAWTEKPTDYSKDWSDGHYVVAIGCDTKNVYFMDPSTLGNYTYIPVDEFLTRWHDTDGRERLEHFGMVVSRDKPSFNPELVKKID